MKKLIILCTFIFLGLPCFAVQNANSYVTLQNAVNAVNNNEDNTIHITGDFAFGPTATSLTVSTNTILKSASGATYTIKGNNTTSPMIEFRGSSSTISNINFSSSTAANPAIYVNIGAVTSGQNYSTFTIDGVTFSYNTSSTSTGGGALNIMSSQWTSISNVTFSTNTTTAGNGGALYYQGEKGFIGENINAYNNAAQQNGGAIYVSTATLISSTFSTNTATTGSGGAVYLSSGTVQNSTFSFNTAQQNGGAIYVSTGTVTSSIFTSNTATGNGGAIYVTDETSLKDSSFFKNIATGNGGAVYNAGTTKIENGTFDKNQAAKGGAIYNAGLMDISNSTISNNKADSDGGAIYAAGTMGIVKSNFTNNAAGGNGGAIYVDSGNTVTINGSSAFLNNTATGNGGAIYVNNASLGLNPLGGTISFQGNTDSSGGNDIYLNGSSILSISTGGTVNFYGGVKGGSILATDTTINWHTASGYNGNLSLTGGALNIRAANAAAFNTVSLNNANLSIQNNVIDNFTPSSLNITGNIPLYIDVDLSNGTVDKVNNVSGTGSFNINNHTQLRILTDSSTVNTFNVTSATLNINEDETFYGPVYTYNLQQTSPGSFQAIQTSNLNPTISALPVAANSKVVANINTVDSLYNRIDVMLSREYLEYADKSSLQEDPYVNMLEEEVARVNGESLQNRWQKMVWFIPNVGYQKVDYGNDVNKVKNTYYGGLIGIDYPVWISNNNAFIPTVFMGYLGSKQKYQETTLNNDSLTAGGMLTYMKDFAILSAQVYVANGSEYYKFKTYSGDFDIFSVTASLKGELNFKLSDKFVMQPALMAIYNFSNLQNYTTANLALVQSTRFHNFLITPSIKFMADSDNWYPYVGMSYNFNTNQKGDVSADNLALPKYKLKNFGEFSVGIENTFLKNYSGYVQVSTYVGSATGVSFQMGIRGYLN